MLCHVTSRHAMSNYITLRYNLSSYEYVHEKKYNLLRQIFGTAKIISHIHSLLRFICEYSHSYHIVCLTNFDFTEKSQKYLQIANVQRCRVNVNIKKAHQSSSPSLSLLTLTGTYLVLIRLQVMFQINHFFPKILVLFVIHHVSTMKCVQRSFQFLNPAAF